jgi:peroxiredoxin family protein
MIAGTLMPERRTVIFVSHADDDALRLAGSCAMTAASMGDRVDVFLFGPALSALVEAKSSEEGEATLLLEARSAGSCRLLGCSASLVAEKVDPEEASQVLDAVIGWPTILEWSRGVVDRFFF